MPTPSDSTPDFSWLKRQPGDSAVLSGPADAAGDSPPAGEAQVPESETTFGETLEADPVPPLRSSDSVIQDIEVSEKSILDDDAPTVKLPVGESSDVVLRNELPSEWQQEDFADSVDESSSADVEAPTLADGVSVVGDDVQDERIQSVLQDSESVGALDTASTSSAEHDSVQGFDLETPVTAAEFSVPYAPSAVVTAPESQFGTSQPATAALPTSVPTKPALSRIVLLSYASAVTLICLFLLLQLMREFRPHQLESLPDVPPLQEGETQYYPIDAILPDGHLLTLGQQRRFGDILVEPLRVTYGPIEYQHWTGEASRSRPPSEESVVKLWVRFTNLSEDKSIAPFDPRLVLESRFRSGRMLTNNYLRRVDSSELELMYDLPPASEWELLDQQFGKVLEPGESFETYAATDFEHLEEIVGKVGSDSHDLVWRLHLRKGYGPAGNGVTTLVDVAFNSGAIEHDG